MFALALLVASFAAARALPSSEVGGACHRASDCVGSTAMCASTLPGGYCSLDCTLNAAACPSSSLCMRVEGALSAQCYARCLADTDCRAGYACAVVGAAGVCVPR
jgi:hypothetical protein